MLMTVFTGSIAFLMAAASIGRGLPQAVRDNTFQGTQKTTIWLYSERRYAKKS